MGNASRESLENLLALGPKGRSPEEKERLIALQEEKIGVQHDVTDRLRIRNYVLQETSKETDINKIFSIITKALTDEYVDQANNYKFCISRAELHLQNNGGGLELVASSGTNNKIRDISKIPTLEQYLEVNPDAEGCLECTIPLVEHGVYQGMIVLSNKESGKQIDLKELKEFLHIYGGLSSTVVYGALQNEKRDRETKRANKLAKMLFERNAELVKEKERADKALQFKNYMIKNIVHDLKNPLMGIIGLSDRINKKLENLIDPEKHQYLTKRQGIEMHGGNFLTPIYKSNIQVNKVARGCYELAVGLLTVERIQSSGELFLGSYKLNNQLESKIKEVSGIKEGEIAKKKIDFLYEPNPLTEEINADRGLMDSIIYNLLINAVIHGEGGPVKIKTTATKKGIYLYVINKGYIKDTEEIFMPYYSSNREKGGTGVGLDSIRQGIEMHGGNVQAYCREDKRIVCLKLYLPNKA